MIMKAIILDSADHFGEASGQVLPHADRIFITCPNCGNRHALKIPPFTYNPTDQTIGPASIRLMAPGCGWHGYMQAANWTEGGDSLCKGPKDEHIFKKESA